MSLDIGVVGLGVGLQAHVPALRAAGFNVVALAARDSGRLERAGEEAGVAKLYTDYDELLARPGLSAVSIATPPPSHHELVMRAFAAGKHVLVEKELASSTQSAKAMSNAASQSGLVAMVAQAFRFSPSRAFVSSLIEEGFIGRPRQVAISFFWGPPNPGPIWPGTHWRNSYATGGGMSGGQMATFLDAVVAWFGPIKSISGRIRASDPERIQENGHPADADDTLAATFETDSHVLGSIVISAAAPFGTGGRFEIFGDQGCIVINQPFIVPSDDDSVSGCRYQDGGKLQALAIPQFFRSGMPDDVATHSMFLPYWPLARAFRLAIEDGSATVATFEESLHLQRLTEGLRESSVTGRSITI